MRSSKPAACLIVLFQLMLVAPALAQSVEDGYVKSEYMIPMRDGVRLYTAVYAPRDASEDVPILMARTPYSCSPYGSDAYRRSLGPDRVYPDAGYMFVYQDVRGCYMSEGTFRNMTPHTPKPLAEKGPADVDESTDTWDTIEWLLEHVDGHNGRVGITGISYPGFYAAASMIDAHPALKASSPQAPIADWWYDDFHHHGALFLPHTFNFMVRFGVPRPGPSARRARSSFRQGTRDGYEWFMRLGSLKHYTERYMGDIAFWQDAVAHPNYDDFWQSRNILPHLDHVAPAVLVVGGWFDAEDLYGPLNIYRAIESRNPGVDNRLVMGPWRHGGWHRGAGDRLGNVSFGSETSPWFVQNVEFPFFEHHLRGVPAPELPEATVFETGTNRWRAFDDWPPAGRHERYLFCGPDRTLSWKPPTDTRPAYDEWTSDPRTPVPFTEEIAIGMTREYMTDDQRFASRRPDVATYRTAVLEEPVTLAGPILAELWVSTSGTASDWIVKVIDVFPPDAEQPAGMEGARELGSYEMMVRSEVIRGRFRHSNAHPEPFVPNEPTQVRLQLQDVLHTFRAGHRIMVQIQSTWFPLVDRNPHHYVDNVFLADDEDFVPAQQRVWRDAVHAAALRVGVLDE